MINLFHPILLQLSVDGLEQASKVSVLDGVLVSIVMILFGIVVYLFKLHIEKVNEVKNVKDDQFNAVTQTHKTHEEKIEELNRKNKEDIEDIIEKYQRLETERNEKQLQSERGLMDLLTAVNNVMKLGDKERQNENKIILDKLNELNRRMDNLKK